MTYPELRDLTRRSQADRARFADRWVAIDPRGGDGIAALPSGAVIVDSDIDLAPLCQRLAEEQRTSLTILYCAAG